MKRHTLAVSLIMASLLGPAAHAQVKVVIYKTSTQVGGGAPYSNPTGTLHSPDIQFGTASHFNWHPYGLSAFGADATGTLDVAATGTYTFILHTDDGSQLFIDNELVVDNGGPHYQATVSGSVSLTQGSHAFEVQYFENGYDDSGLDLNLPPGVSYGDTTPRVVKGSVPGRKGQHKGRIVSPLQSH